jgi:hypothetical protein
MLFSTVRSIYRTRSAFRGVSRCLQYLSVSIDDYDAVEKLGASWNKELNKWYIDDKVSASAFSRWVDHSTIEASINETGNADLERRYLAVPFSDKDCVKFLGARWDSAARKWFVPDGIYMFPFRFWRNESESYFSDDEHEQPKAYLDVLFETNYELERLGARWDDATRRYYVPSEIDIREFRDFLNFYIDIPFDENQNAKALGAVFDGRLKKWYIPSNVPKTRFKIYLRDYFCRFLDVPFEERDEAKKAGAHWDAQYKSWFVPPESSEEVRSVLENQWGRHPLDVPFEKKDQAKTMGARWDSSVRIWYCSQRLLSVYPELQSWLLYNAISE